MRELVRALYFESLVHTLAKVHTCVGWKEGVGQSVGVRVGEVVLAPPQAMHRVLKVYLLWSQMICLSQVKKNSRDATWYGQISRHSDGMWHVQQHERAVVLDNVVATSPYYL